MLETYLMLLIIFHFALWLLGVYFEIPGFVMVAILLDMLTIGEAAMAIEYPVPLQNSTSQVFTVQATSDPSLAMALFILLVFYIVSFYEMAGGLPQDSEEKPRKRVTILVPEEWIRR